MSQPSIVMPCNKRIMIKRKEFNWYASWVIIDLNSLVSIINTRELKYFLIRETSCVITDNFPGLFTKYDWQLGSHLSSILRGAVHFTLPGFKSQSSWRRLLNSCSTFFFLVCVVCLVFLFLTTMAPLSLGLCLLWAIRLLDIRTRLD